MNTDELEYYKQRCAQLEDNVIKGRCDTCSRKNMGACPGWTRWMWDMTYCSRWKAKTR